MKKIYGAITAFLLASVLPFASAHALTSPNGSCTHVLLPVSLGVGQPATQTIAGTLCTPLVWAPGSHAIDILSPGGTYNSLYWNWPQDPQLYSYVDKTLQAGRATFDYDRLGTGQSSHPLSTSFTLPTEAYVLHEILSWARGEGYSQVNSLGHSYGSMVALQEAGTYNDANRLVITGLLHIPNIGVGLPRGFASLWPAALDPEFAGSGLDLGYVTTEPGTRGSLFYASSADPTVISYDEAHKDVISSTAVATSGTTYAVPAPLNASDRITEPVFVVVGQEDGLFCTVPGGLDCSSAASVRTAETPYYLSAASLDTAVVPNTGHDVALHPSANTSFGMINQWLETH